MHEGVRVLEHTRRNHLSGALIAEKEDRQTVVATSLCCQHFLEDLPLFRTGLGAVDGHEPARLAVEHFGQSLCVRVTDPGDYAKTLLLDSFSKLAHADARRMFAFIVFVDDGDRESLEEIHGPLLRRR